MATIKKTDVVLPELLVDAIKGYFSGMAVMQGSGAAVVSTSMPNGYANGDSVKIPYFGSLGEAEDLTTDGDALTPAAFSASSETATVYHSGKAFDMTRWAQAGASDPYEECARQVVESVRRRIDKALLDGAKSATSWTSYIYDASAIGSGIIDYDAIVEARKLLGDEADDWAAFACHSKVFGDMLKMRDSAGRPLLLDMANPQAPKLTVLGVPVIVTDRLTATATVYPSLLMKRNALAAWINGTPTVLTDTDILANSDIVAVHVYWAAHRYTKLSGMSKPGVVILKTK